MVMRPRAPAQDAIRLGEGDRGDLPCLVAGSGALDKGRRRAIAQAEARAAMPRPTRRSEILLQPRA